LPRFDMTTRNPFDGYGSPIKLVVADLDGTITADELKPFDCQGLSVLRRYNDLSRREGDRTFPPISLVTGRPHSYLEAFARFIGTPLPSLFESGCGMHLPTAPLGHEYLFHPALAAPRVSEALERFRAWAEDELVAKRGAGVILGKKYSVSLAAGGRRSVEGLLEATRAMPADLAPLFVVTRSIGVVDVTPRPVDKGSGFGWLLRYLRSELGFDVAAANVVGVGDSYNDLPFLAKVGISCAVPGAAAEVRDAVDYVAVGPTASGVVEIIELAAALNRGLGYR
jgi:HAD superfamily hydrolase (TIGR01484 family)